LGKELDVDLFEVFMGVWDEWAVPMILDKYHLIDGTEFNDIHERMFEANAESVLRGYVIRAYFDYRAHRTASVEIAGAPQSQLSSPTTLRTDLSKIWNDQAHRQLACR
jgi:hypothetical protein